MIKKITASIMIMIFAQGCAVYQSTTARVPSQEAMDSCSLAFQNIELGADKILVLEASELLLERLKSCHKEVDINLDEHDRLMYFKSVGQGILIKTLHGKLLYLKAKNLSSVDVKFPVASFSVEQDQVKLFSSSDKGRFCTSKIIENNSMSSEPSCKNAADKIEIKDL